MRRFIPCLLLALFLPLSQTVNAAPDQTKALRELKKIDSFNEGAKAMSDKLPDVAVQSFRTALASKNLSSHAKAYATLYLAEALVTASLSPQADPALAVEALKLLENKNLKGMTMVSLLRAEAYAGQGRYALAAEALASVPTSHPQRTALDLARARIFIALRRYDEALDLLKKMSATKDRASSKLRQTARILQAEIYLDKKLYEQAAAALKQVDDQYLHAAQLKSYLQAQLALSEGQSAAAIEQFKNIIATSENLSERIHHASVLGLADAQTANQQSADAVATLMNYISNHKDSTALQPMFMRLVRILPKELPNDDATIKQFAQWASPVSPPTLQSAPASASELALTDFTQCSDLQALATYYQAQLLARSEKPANRALAMALFTRLRSLYAGCANTPSELWHRLSSASLLDVANLHLVDGNKEMATFTLSVMEKVAFSPRLKNQASFLRGHLLAKDGRPEDAMAAFEYARESASQDIAAAAQINSGITSLLASDLKAFEKVLISADRKPVKVSLLLERALWKCTSGDITGRTELESFIMANPGHVRENEARLALAAACVHITPPDVILARAQLEEISPKMTTAEQQLAITQLRMKTEDLAADWLASAEAAHQFIQRFPTHPGAVMIQLKQGEALYHNEDYGRARAVFQGIIEKHPNSDAAGYARFYTALAARHGGTTQAREESIRLFQEVIDKKHPLATESRIQLGRVQIDLGQLEEAEKTLSPLVTTQTAAKAPILQRSAGILLADCYHRQGATDPAGYQKAVSVYQRILAQEKLPLAWRHRIHFLQGQSYEAAGNKAKAFSSYYGVIISQAPENKETEWLWFYRCGFKALAMLENDKRWVPAVKLAKRIASFPGPRAEEAHQRADTLAKKHMIWEE